jgi:MFS family permease
MIASALARLCRGRIDYAWIALAVSFVVIMGTVGVRSAPGVIILPLQQAFGWDIGTISAAISLNLLLLGLVGPFVTGMMEVIGLKRTMLLCLAVLLAGTGLANFISAPWQFFLTWGVLVGIGVSGGAMGMAAAVANRWFTRHRSFAMGLLMAANAAGQLVFLPILGTLAQHRGWQSVSLAVTLVVAALVPLVALLLPDSPASIGLVPLGATRDEPVVRAARNPFAASLQGLLRGLRSVDFWLIAVAFGICGSSTAGLVGTHLIAYCVDNGYGQAASAGLLGSLGVSSLLGSIASGWLADRWNPRLMLFWIFVLRGVSLLLLPYSGFGPVSLTLFAVFNGVEWVATVPPIVALLNEVFGKRDAPVLVAWIYAGNQVGSAAAAMAGGITRDITGSYAIAFLATGLACLLAAGLVMRIARSEAATVAA